MSHLRLPGRALGFLAILTAFSQPPARAEGAIAVRPRDPRLQVERLSRRLDWRDGLAASYLTTVVQDRQGFLWVSGPGGLARYDGRTFTRFYERATGLISGCGPSGRIVFCGPDLVLREVEGGKIVDLHSPRSDDGSTDWGAALSETGDLWLANGESLWLRARGGDWTPMTSPAPPGEPVRSLIGGRGHAVFAFNRSTLWKLLPDGTSRVVGRIRGVHALVERTDGSLLVAANQPPGPVTARLFEVRDDVVTPLFERTGSKVTGLAVRGARAWLATDTGIFGLAANAAPVFVASDEISGASGDVFVDREGSLWLATFRGLMQLPEPETYAVSYVKVARNLAHVGSRTWLSSWGELARFDDGPAGLVAHSYGPNYGIVCADAAGRAWAPTQYGLAVAGDDGYEQSAGASTRGDVASCTLGPTGTLWMSSTGGRIFVVERGAARPREVHVTLPDGVGSLDGVREAPDGSLWTMLERGVCRTSARDVLAGTKATWTCEDHVSEGIVIDLAFMPSGDVWLATSEGIVRRENGHWESLEANARFRSRWLHAIRQSPSGGFWVVSMGAIARVIERPGTPEGLEIVEELSAWQGVPTLNGSDIAEDPDGTLWIATDAGLLKIPGTVRHARPEPPPVVLIEASADGRTLPDDRATELPYRRNRLELRFAATSYRDPPAIRYRHRLHADEAWSAPTTSPLFRFVDLSPGRYRIEVEASLDGSRWSAMPAVFAFRVLRPWYLQAWFFAAAAAALAAGLTLVYRARVRTLLRLERQRTRIAMDLHDEVGSGLGTISVLAGIVSKGDLDPARRGEFAARIASVSRELSQALGDIVWSLRPGSGTLDAAWNQILDRARPLFASGSPRLETRAPEPVPAIALSVVARRALFLVALEALHNAARHSGAGVVELALARDGADWLLTVTDDGTGLPANPAPGGRRGLGLDGMRARAAEMNASIVWAPAAGGGTHVVLRFRPSTD